MVGLQRPLPLLSRDAGRPAQAGRDGVPKASITTPPNATSPIHRVTQLDLVVGAHRWPFADLRRGEIESHFAVQQIETPELWNGRILLGRDPVLEGDAFRADYFETDFASFLAWRDWDFPDRTVFNGFGMGALRGNDGGFVLGEMAAHTANAGRIYFPAGTPDLNDVTGGRVDIAGSVAREVLEETGLSPSDYRASPYWDCVVSGRLIALMRRLDVDMPAAQLQERITTFLASQEAPELSAIHVVRRRGDLTPRMPAYMHDYLTAQLDA
jgi:8-oxo-dGTP pyrophosphatase MutT (NUDIX family)